MGRVRQCVESANIVFVGNLYFFVGSHFSSEFSVGINRIIIFFCFKYENNIQLNPRDIIVVYLLEF